MVASTHSTFPKGDRGGGGVEQGPLLLETTSTHTGEGGPRLQRLDEQAQAPRAPREPAPGPVEGTGLLARAKPAPPPAPAPWQGPPAPIQQQQPPPLGAMAK
mmetsp:Transcript_28785/g.61236  ORF Transcript_28785/g.61236 Transcript_28785/m.61236 type:complete len:102 (+) Transcript_28785:360-665(+)